MSVVTGSVTYKVIKEQLNVKEYVDHLVEGPSRFKINIGNFMEV